MWRHLYTLALVLLAIAQAVGYIRIPLGAVFILAAGVAVQWVFIVRLGRRNG